MMTEHQYKEYCTRLEEITTSPMYDLDEREISFEIEMLTLLIEQYQDHQDLRRMYRELIIRSQCALPTRPGEIEQFDQGIRPEDAHKVLAWIIEDDEKNPIDL